MSPIVKNFTDFSTPDVFLREAEPAAALRGSSIGVVGIVVQSIRGPVGVPTDVSSLSDFIRLFGGFDKILPEGFMFAYNLFKQGATNVKVVRVTDGDEAAATGALLGAASGTIFAVTSPGTWGNEVTLNVSASTVAGYFDLTFKYGNGEVYSYKQVSFADPSDDRYVETVLQNAPENFVEVVSIDNNTPSTGTIAFSGGSNGTLVGDNLLDSAYIGTDGVNGKTGLVAFEAVDDINFVCTPRCTDSVNAALRDHVALVTIAPRMAIIAPAKGATVDQVKTMMASFNNDQVIVTYPFLQIVNPYNNKKEYHAPTSFYAGVLSTLSYEQSPSRKQINGVVGTERALTRAEVDVLSQNRVSPITLLAGQGFVIRNGYNSSSNPAKSNITRRRAANFFAKAFEAGAQQFVSRPHTVALRNDVKTAFGSLIENELALGRIGNVNGGKAYAVKCDAQNNPDSIVRANKLMVDVQISLLAPADFIAITLDASEAKVITLE